MLKRTLSAVALAMMFVGSAGAQDTLPITIGAAGATDHAPVFAGVERGIFAAHGLDANVEMYQSGVDMVNGLLNGAQHVNAMGSVPYISGLANGFPLVLIGHLHGDPTRDSYSDNQSIVASAASGIEAGDVAALEGRRIGLPRGTGAEGFLLGVLGEVGIAEDDVELINVSPAELVTALNQGDVDAIAIWEPWGSTALVRVEGATRLQQGGCPSCYDPGTLLTTQSVIDDDSETLTRFMAAFAEAQRWVRNNRDEAAEINMRWIQGIDLPTMQLALSTASLDSRMSTYTAAMYQEKTMPFLMGLGRIDEVFDPAYAINPSFLDAALESHPEFYSDLPEIPADIRLQ